MCCNSNDYANLSDEALVERINTGDNALLKELFTRFDNILRIKANHYSADSDIDDYVQEGLIALFSATKVYNPSLSSFSTFASVCIERAMCSLYRKKFAKSQIPDDKLVFTDDLGSFIVEPNPESSLIDKEECRLLAEKIKNSLSSFEYRVLLAFLSGDSNDKISIRLNEPIKKVNNALFRARAKIKTLH